MFIEPMAMDGGPIMANEIVIQAQMQCTNGDYQLLPTKTVYANVDQATAGKLCVILSAGTTEAAITLTDLTAAGYALVRNLDATNYVELGVKPASTFYPLLKLMPGGAHQLICFAGSVAPYLKADTAACDVELDILDA